MKLRLSLMFNQWKAFLITLRHGENLDKYAFDYFSQNKILTGTQIKLLKIFK